MDRQQLYRALEGTLGPEVARVLSDRIPIMEDLATKSDIDNLRAATKSDIDNLRAATKSDIENLRAATKSDIENLRLSVEGRIDNRFGELMRSMLALFLPLYLATLMALVAALFKI